MYKRQEDERIESVPLTLTVEGEDIVDDETFDQASFLKKVADSPNCPKSSCPSPERYMQAYDCGADHVYAVTLSASLSGSYNSADVYKRQYKPLICSDLSPACIYAPSNK